MNDILIITIGLIAGVLTTLAQLPQIIKIIKTKSVGDISIGMYFMLVTGVSLWVFYGFLILSLPVVAANSIALILVSTIFFLKIRYKRIKTN
jgi:MtN3 and saliva related transmembrane protein